MRGNLARHPRCGDPVGSGVTNRGTTSTTTRGTNRHPSRAVVCTGSSVFTCMLSRLGVFHCESATAAATASVRDDTEEPSLQSLSGKIHTLANNLNFPGTRPAPLESESPARRVSMPHHTRVYPGTRVCVPGSESRRYLDHESPAESTGTVAGPPTVTHSLPGYPARGYPEA
eukprot:711860-Rhodomonas_salina.1